MSQNKTAQKKKIAVFFGGRSPEHDVSVVSGLQAMQAVDGTRYEVFPVYITPQGEWLTGDVLRSRGNYMLSKEALKQTVSVSLDIMPGARGRLLPRKGPLVGQVKPVEFDAALLVFHGLYGEDGQMQGALEMAGIPYTGMRTMASAVMMDKGATKKIAQALGIPCLPYRILNRPAEGYFIKEDVLKEIVGDLPFPCIIKPSHLGSSIGVAKVKNIEELSACLPPIFEFDDAAILEPFVENMVEYNVAVARIGGEVKTSAIERPKTHDELLDFKQKYLSGGDGKTGGKSGGSKSAGQISEGMLSLTREINPKLAKELEGNIRGWAVQLFEGVAGSGAPRLDFIGNSKTGEVWLNEVNPCPGSLGYFLWEAAEKPVLFTAFLNSLIEEAFLLRRSKTLPKDPVPVDARLFKRAL